jgi:hypothetical protein
LAAVRRVYRRPSCSDADEGRMNSASRASQRKQTAPGNGRSAAYKYAGPASADRQICAVAEPNGIGGAC